MLGSKALAGLRLSDNLNAGPFERPADLFDRFELGVDSTRHSFNPANGCDARAGCNGQMKLLPSHQTTGDLDLLCPNERSFAPCLLSILCKNRGAFAGTPIRVDWREAAVAAASP
ncbi:hypothetical protein [Bradyrhizobium sp. B117]|uniref:hypothetical protein n=1 Tax=Bradyrhizobium sp. B117 TaxID=3140246 RepID=UPI003183027F